MKDKMLWSLLGLCLLLRLLLLLVPVETLIALDIYNDDAFYYLKIAKNIVAGNGMVFSQGIYTNGFQPLYLILLLPAFVFWPHNLEMPVYYSVLLLSILSTGSGYLIYRLTYKFSSSVTALLALACWSVSPYFIFNGINGLETSVATFFALLVIYKYLCWLSQGGSMFVLGVAAGLAFLARIDFVLLGAVLLLHYLITVRDMRRLGGALSGFLAVTLPWFAVSFCLTGTLLPQSGNASNFIAHCMGWLGLDRFFSSATGALLFNPDYPPFAYYLDLAARFICVALFENPLLIWLRPQAEFSTYIRLGDYSLYRLLSEHVGISVITFLILFAAISAGVWRCYRRNGLLALLWLLLLSCGYVFYSAAHWYYPRYLYTALTLLLIFGLPLLTFREYRTVRWLLLAVLAVNVLHLSSYAVGNQIFVARQEKFLKAWKQASRLIKPAARIGAYQAGIFSYFGDRDIINLDGKVNPAAFEHLKQRRLGEYIEAQKLDYLLDSESIVLALYSRFDRNARLKPLALVNKSTRSVLYAVSRQTQSR